MSDVWLDTVFCSCNANCGCQPLLTTSFKKRLVLAIFTDIACMSNAQILATQFEERKILKSRPCHDGVVCPWLATC